MKNYKSGFSFAEIMISLVVVGIISMLVIPNLLDNSTNRTNVTAAAKARYDIGQASMRLQTECPRFRCRAQTASQHMQDLLQNTGTLHYSVSNQYNDGTDNIIEVLVDVDEDEATDLSVAATQSGGIKDIANCSYETYENGAGCTDQNISSLTSGNKTRNGGGAVGFTKLE